MNGGAVEIGLHHGKSFISLCLALRDDQKAYGIDIFEEQALNLDHSGHGDRQTVEQNLARLGVDNAILDARSSERVHASDILNAVGEVRFFSIDGGHWPRIVENDLRLAEAVLAEHGVIALDDFHRADWPNVSAGYFSWQAEQTKSIVPLAIGPNKLYLCLDGWAERYRNVLLEDHFLNHFIVKNCDFQGYEIPVYRFHFEEEQGFKTRALEFIRLYHPASYVDYVRIKRAILGRR